jgi:hypothetical protein
MRIQHYPASLTQKEKELLELILELELSIQSWRQTAFSDLLFEEVVIGTQ